MLRWSNLTVLLSGLSQALFFPQFLSELFELRLEGLRVAKINESIVAAMGSFDSQRMTNRTPILFGPRGDFTREGDGAVEIGTEIAIELFNSIEISKFVSVQADVIPTVHFWNSIDGETDRLVEAAKTIQHKGGHDHRVNDRRGQDEQKIRLIEIFYQSHAK